MLFFPSTLSNSATLSLPFNDAVGDNSIMAGVVLQKCALFPNCVYFIHCLLPGHESVVRTSLAS